MRNLSLFVLIISVSVLSLFAGAESVQAQADKSWADSLNALSLSGQSEPTLQYILDSLGYDIDVANDEIGIEIFCAKVGVNTVHMVVEYARSARTAESGYYLAGDPSSRVRLFRRWNKPGDSAQFNVDGGQIGFYVEPNLRDEKDYKWYTEAEFNKDTLDHAKVFLTGQPGEYLIAFEDVFGGGDSDFQDLVLRAQLGVAQPQLVLPADFNVIACERGSVCFDISALLGDCVSDPFRLEMLRGEGTFETLDVTDSTTVEHCFNPAQSGKYDFVFRLSSGKLAFDDTLSITVTINSAPVCTVPNDTAITLCAPQEICLPVSAIDSDGNLTLCEVVSGPGTTADGQWCFTPQSDSTYVITIRCLDDCGASCESSFTVTVTGINTPTCDLPNDTTITLCIPDQISIPISDANCVQSSGPGTIQNGSWAYTSTISETVTVGISCANECGVYCEDSFSVAIEIRAGQVYRLELSPTGDVSRTAGDTISFSVTAYDCADNIVPTDGLQLGFTQGSDNIGQFDGRNLIVTRVGTAQVLAAIGNITTTSGTITVTPGALATIDLQIFPTQFVGLPLIHSATLYLFDAFGNPKTDYDLSSSPITLITTSGQLDPTVISDPSLLIDGAVDILGSSVTYTGPSGLTGISASNGLVSSDAVAVTFNKYEIVSVLDSTGAPLDRVLSDVSTTINPVIVNDGNLIGESGSRVIVILASQTTGGESLFDPANPGAEDTLVVTLPPSGSQSGFDTLITIVETDFKINGETYTIADTVFTPVTVTSSTPAANWSIVPESFKPDTAFLGLPVYPQFVVLTPGAGAQIDSSIVKITILREVGDPSPFFEIEEILPAINVNNGEAVYAGFAEILSATAGVASGWYPVRVELVGYSSGQSFTLDNEYPDSIQIFQQVDVHDVPGSLGPSVIAPGVETSFSFDIEVTTEVPLTLENRGSGFTLISKRDSNNRIYGNLRNVPETVTSGTYTIEMTEIIVPGSFVGDTLMARASLRYRVPGSSVSVGLKRFLSPEILVLDQPIVKIVSFEVDAPNVPYVNTNQEFDIVAKVANVSDRDAYDVGLKFTTDGQSSYSGIEFIALFDTLRAYDTASSTYILTAGPNSDPLETFTLNITEGDYMVALPDDNSASVIVQTPADLSLDRRLFGVRDGEVTSGQTFSLSVQLKNAGQGSVEDATYQLSTPGELFDSEPTITGSLSEGEVITFDFTAPSLDTNGTFTFSLTQSVTELNTLQPANIDDTTFSFDITVTMLAGGLVVEPTILQDDIVGKNTVAKLFSLSLSNTSNVTDISVTEIILDFSGERGGIINLRDLLKVSETSFLENNSPVSSASIVGDQLILSFADLTLAPTQTRRITFEASITGASVSGFTVELDRDQIGAYFSAGATLGSRAPIISSITDQVLVQESYTIRGGTLDDSFVIKDNPFDPTENPAIFSYSLSRPSAVDFEIYSLIGERVYSFHIPFGQSGTSAGRHTLEWNGLNDEGRQVLNGVYVASLRALSLGEEARIKVAVVK